MGYVRFKIVYDRMQDPDALLAEVDTLLRRRAEARDRKVAEQIALPIGAAGAAATPRPRRRSRPRSL